MRMIRAACLVGLLATAAMPAIGCGKTVSRGNVNDVGITTLVKTALLNEPNLSARAINVNTANGIVTLSGSVASEAEREHAVAVARRTSGVAEVRSSLQVAAN